MPTLDNLLEHKDDPMRKQLQRQMLKAGMMQVANTKLETVRKNLKPKFEMNSLREELNDVYSVLLYSFEGKAQKALAQRISESAKLIVNVENDGETFVNSFKTR
ncbi:MULTISPECIES: hypothetical protein [Bacillus]|uniref:hypothetical protein n=1 Tax=Bacillus TaxID=1386 RepID=UPI000B8C4DC7|nr:MULTISPECIES: hypothetical protein [Bacillus]ATX84865.1 hypothetical protein CU084_18265 [Bacillus velezensis]MCM3105659.1 hypothetical protein [Bacillus velezensis]MCW8787363.1 hypothetical protein [Bacillus velezensis]MDP1498365.1 hypothetical protein [Bacillus velezensis]MDQ9148762.1 hypothetical protein [Bacillus velezensis]